MVTWRFSKSHSESDLATRMEASATGNICYLGQELEMRWLKSETVAQHHAGVTRCWCVLLFSVIFTTSNRRNTWLAVYWWLYIAVCIHSLHLWPLIRWCCFSLLRGRALQLFIKQRFTLSFKLKTCFNCCCMCGCRILKQPSTLTWRPADNQLGDELPASMMPPAGCNTQLERISQKHEQGISVPDSDWRSTSCPVVCIWCSVLIHSSLKNFMSEF